MAMQENENCRKKNTNWCQDHSLIWGCATELAENPDSRVHHPWQCSLLNGTGSEHGNATHLLKPRPVASTSTGKASLFLRSTDE